MLAPSQVVVQEVQMVVAAMARVEEAMGMVAAVAMGMVEVAVAVVMGVAAEAAVTVAVWVGVRKTSDKSDSSHSCICYHRCQNTLNRPCHLISTKRRCS